MPLALKSFSFLPFLVATSAAAAQSVVFRPRVDFGMAQENAQQAVCADFDRDGNLDIAATMEGYNQGKVEVLFGDGQSDFGTSDEYVSYVAWGLAKGDFNGDGWVDLAATSYGWAQHRIRIWMNDQQGGLFGNLTVAALGSPPAGVVTGDFDHDGKLDLAAISEGGGWAVDWFRGDGLGGFSTFRPVPNTLGLVGKRIYVGHFDADPHLDLLAVHQTGAMVLLNDNVGTGNFASSNGIALNESTGSAAVADLDGDGRDDIVTAGANLRVWRGLGNGQFAAVHSQSTTTGALETLLADLDADHLLDAVVIGLNGVQLFRGLPGAQFAAPQSVPSGVYPKSGAVGDWNGDGWLDLAVLCQNYAGQSSYLSIHDQVPPTVAASATAYGQGCGAPALAFSPDSAARPVLGGTARADLTSPPSLLGGVALGFSDQFLGAVPLPLDLTFAGMTGCALLQSTELPMLPLAVNGSGLRFALPVPSDLALLRAHVYVQAYVSAPGQNSAQLVLSNGIDWLLGNQ